MAFPPIDWLFDASEMSLQEARLSALNRSANLAKVIRHEMEEWKEQERTAGIVEFFLKHRKELLSRSQIDVQPQKVEWFKSERKKSA